MQANRGHQVLILIVDNNIRFLSRIIQELEYKGFFQDTDSETEPSMERPVIIKKNNVEIVLTPSFDEAQERLSDPSTVAAFLDGNLEDPRPNCTGEELAKISIALEAGPSIYSISDSEYMYEHVIRPAFVENAGREYKHLGKCSLSIVNEIEIIVAHYNAAIGGLGHGEASETLIP